MPLNPCKQHAANRNLTVLCYECNKSRLIYSKNKVSASVTSKFKRVSKDLLYTSGTAIAELAGTENLKELHIQENQWITVLVIQHVAVIVAVQKNSSTLQTNLQYVLRARVRIKNRSGEGSLSKNNKSSKNNEHEIYCFSKLSMFYFVFYLQGV